VIGVLAQFWLFATGADGGDPLEPDPAAPIEDLDLVGSLLGIVGWLAAICILFYIIIRSVLPRMARAAGGQGFRMGGGKVVRIVDRCPLEAKKTVFLLEVAGRYLLVGAADGSISRIAGEADLDEPEIRRLIGAPPAHSFSSLMKKMGRGQSDPKPDPQ